MGGVNVKDPARWNAGVVASKDGESLTQSQDIPEGFCQCGCGERTPLAKHTSTRDRTVKGQPVRFVRGHSGGCRFTGPRYIEEDRGHDTSCWIWQAHVGQNGYGQIRVRGKIVGAHRWMYEMRHGPIANGLHVDHLCRNRACVNPDHLEPVTPAENSRRGSKTRLTASDAEQIRRSDESHAALASRFGVHPVHIGQIKRGESWRQ